jgi:hypothetical protein
MTLTRLQATVPTSRVCMPAHLMLAGRSPASSMPPLRDLEVALEHVELDDTRSVHLHVTELDFADAATIRRLTAFARQVRRAGHDVKTCGASPTLRKVARLLQVHDDLGLA